MSLVASPVVIYVSYAGGPSDRFDRDYYVDRHLPLVMQYWQALGLSSVTAFFPEVGHAGTVAICECVFRDEAAAAAAFGSPEAAMVMADIRHFTDLEPRRQRALAL